MAFKENFYEYQSLRNELIATQGARENAILYMYTVYVAFFVLSIQSTHYLLLATFVVLVPFQARILRAQATIVKISSFIRLFFEKERTDMHWESMQEFLTEHPCFAQTKENIIDKLSGTGATQLGCLSAGFFIFKIIKEASEKQHPAYIELPDAIAILVSLAGIAITVYMTMKYKKSSYKPVEKYIAHYQKEIIDNHGHILHY